jgi:acetyl/propionyl-CoA carboxylase alpha subunit
MIIELCCVKQPNFLVL